MHATDNLVLGQLPIVVTKAHVKFEPDWLTLFPLGYFEIGKTGGGKMTHTSKNLEKWVYESEAGAKTRQL